MKNIHTYLIEKNKSVIVEIKNYKAFADNFSSMLVYFISPSFISALQAISTWILVGLVNILLVVYAKRPDVEGEEIMFYDNGASVLYGAGIALEVVSSFWFFLVFFNFCIIWPDKVREEVQEKFKIVNKNKSIFVKLSRLYIWISEYAEAIYAKMF